MKALQKLKNWPLIDKIALGIGALIAVSVFAMIISQFLPERSLNEESVAPVETPKAADTAVTPKEEQEPQIVTYGIGESAEFGDYIITVKKAASEVTEEDSRLLDVQIEVKNNGKEPVNVDSSYFKLLDAEDREFDPSDSVSFGGDPIFMYDSINPGLKLTKKVKFEIPADVTSAKLAMRDNMFDLGGADYIYFDLGTVK